VTSPAGIENPIRSVQERIDPERAASAGVLRVAMILLNNSTVGGTERRFAQVYERLRRRGLPISLLINESLLQRLQESRILCAHDDATVVLEEPAARMLRIVRPRGKSADKKRGPSGWLWWRKLDYLHACLSVRRRLTEHRPRLVHAALGGAYVALVAQWLGIAPPVVLSVVCPNLEEMVPTRLGRRLYRAALRKAQTVDALTEDVATMVRQEGIAADRIRVSPGSCVDTDRFRAKALRRPWIVFSGRLIEEKNPHLFVEACALVRPRWPEARFFMFGDGPLREEVTSLIRQRGLDREMSLGWNPQVESILSEALVFVSLQKTDNYPSQALLEAMACGAAVIATDVGLTWKLVDEAVGFRVQPEPIAVAARMLALLEDRSLALSLGRRARDRVIGLHSMDAYADYLDKLYTATAAGNVRGATFEVRRTK
jgi:glycosyltransferase involved in cell wall biosynthesis